MADDGDEGIDCAMHGHSAVIATVCRHQLESATSVGFVENSDEPDDQQAWCDACEALFLKEGSLTRKFRTFCDFGVVCGECYADIKRRHTVRRSN